MSSTPSQPNPPPGSNDPTGNPFPPKQSPPQPAGDDGPVPEKKEGFWHKVEDSIGEALGEAIENRDSE